MSAMDTKDPEKQRMLDIICEKDAEIARLKDWNRKFFDRVRFMRSCQKEYYETRTYDVLQKSKALEREVDTEIARLEKGLEARESRKRVDDAAQMLIDGFGFERMDQ